MSPHGPRTRSNLLRSNFTHLSGLLAITVAALGLSNSSAISPESKNKKNFVFDCGIK